MTDCEHPTSKISRVDGEGCVHIEDRIYVWGECECGTPTIVTTRIEEVERDGKGTIAHLDSKARNND